MIPSEVGVVVELPSQRVISAMVVFFLTFGRENEGQSLRNHHIDPYIKRTVLLRTIQIRREVSALVQSKHIGDTKTSNWTVSTSRVTESNATLELRQVTIMHCTTNTYILYFVLYYTKHRRHQKRTKICVEKLHITNVYVNT